MYICFFCLNVLVLKIHSWIIYSCQLCLNPVGRQFLDMYIKYTALASDLHVIANYSLIFITLSLPGALLHRAPRTHSPSICSPATQHCRALFSAELLSQMNPAQHHFQQQETGQAA